MNEREKEKQKKQKKVKKKLIKIKKLELSVFSILSLPSRCHERTPPPLVIFAAQLKVAHDNGDFCATNN